MKYQILDWDSDFFGIKVARIKASNLKIEKLTNLLTELKQKRVKLVSLGMRMRMERSDPTRSIDFHEV